MQIYKSEGLYKQKTEIVVECKYVEKMPLIR